MNDNRILNILLADDDDDDALLFKEALQHLMVKANLIIAENGHQLLTQLSISNDNPDIIFLDMNMPIKNGLECLSEIRSIEKYVRVPIIILSTSVADYLLHAAHQAGANLYIQDPTSFSKLIQIIEKCLSLRLDIVPAPPLESFLVVSAH